MNQPRSHSPFARLFQGISALFERCTLALIPRDFEIRHRPGVRLAVRGKIPAGRVAELHAFFAADHRLACPLTILGRRLPGRRLDLRIVGPLSSADRQRVRNYLIDQLQ